MGDKVALTPPIGWNDWYIHYQLVTDKTMRQAADMMVESGMADAVYSFLWSDGYSNPEYVQLSEDDTLDAAEKEGLKSFIRSITTSTGDSVEQRDSPRSMVDMLELVKRYFYHASMKGSNSIKDVLPAILNSSDYIRERYSKPIYGKLPK